MQLLARPYIPEDAINVEIVQYTGNGDDPRSHTGVGFQPTHIEIQDDVGTNDGSILYVSSNGTQSVMWDVALTCWRATNAGEHLTIDSDGFTTTGLGNNNEVHFTAACFR